MEHPSTYGDTVRMLTLSRGLHPLWLNDQDAADTGIHDGDWVEVVNDHGAIVTKAVVSARVPRGIAMQYHAPERTVATPRTPSRGGRRAACSLMRIRLKPTLMLGAYGQISVRLQLLGTHRDEPRRVRARAQT